MFESSNNKGMDFYHYIHDISIKFVVNDEKNNEDYNIKQSKFGDFTPIEIYKTSKILKTINLIDLNKIVELFENRDRNGYFLHHNR